MKKSIDIELVLMVAISIAIGLTAAIGFGDATGLYAEDLGDEERISTLEEKVEALEDRISKLEQLLSDQDDKLILEPGTRLFLSV